ncbi:MAG TPA: HAD family hydrolase [Ilumatobacteraceae bacterium]|jgi:putative hydrolase of the HAD superfamily|nr:HAD family hydrolase [Ilumatobacteraceae bacterium]
MSDFDRFEAMSFDCYGTLIDWETGIANALRPWARRNGLDLDDQALIAAHGRYETHVQDEMPSALYPVILGETLRRVGAELGAPVTDEDAAAYGASVKEWPAFPDTAEALQRLATKFKLIILSNIDRASFAASAPRLGVQFDAIITAEDVGSYKPQRGHFDRLFEELDRLGVARDRLVHVAESLFHDHEPAAELGLPSVWIHRRHDKGGTGATATPSGEISPTWRFTSMAEFAAAAVPA